MYQHILLPIDLGNESTWVKALPVATNLCLSYSALLHVLTVVPEYGLPMVSQYFPKDHEAQMRKNAQTLLRRFVSERISDDIRVQCIVGEGTIYKTIIDTAEEIDADLIVVGAHRDELEDYLLGPNAARVVRHSKRSVLVVR